MHLPAILGGAPLRPDGLPAWPMPDDDIRAVLDQAYRDGWWARYQAGQSELLQARLREFFQVEHVLLCGSGNYAVELGLRALQIGPGDEVILADYDYPGNFLSIHAVGALPVLADVDPANWNLSQTAVRQSLGPRVKAVIASHVHGGRVPMRELMELAREKGLLVLEDAAQAPGAIVDGRRAGTWGHVGVLSFGGSKLLCAGRGGALLTPHADLAQRARNHLVRAGNIVCPMSEIQAALVVPQLAKLDERNNARWSNVRALCNHLNGLPGLTPFVSADEPALPAFYKLGLQVDEVAFGLSRAAFITAMRAEGFTLDEGFAAAHVARSPKRFRQGSELNEAERAHAGCVQVHHPILLEGSAALEPFADACRRIQHHAAAIRDKIGA